VETLCQVESDVHASRVLSLLVANDIHSEVVRLGDTAYPGVVDRMRPYAVIRVPQDRLSQAKALLASYGGYNNMPDDDIIGNAWETAPHPDTVAPPSIHTKSPKVAALLSLLLPGTGQFYADRIITAACIFCIWLAIWFFEPRLVIAIAIIAAVDAYRGCN